MSAKETITIQIELTDNEAWELAQFCKRISFDDARRLATSNDETYTMLQAIAYLRVELREKGYAPR